MQVRVNAVIATVSAVLCLMSSLSFSGRANIGVMPIVSSQTMTNLTSTTNFNWAEHLRAQKIRFDGILPFPYETDQPRIFSIHMPHTSHDI